MRWMRYKKALFVTCLLWVTATYFVWQYMSAMEAADLKSMKDDYVPTILWWTSMPANYKAARYCGHYQCNFVSDRNALKRSKVVLIYGSDIKVDDLPIPRAPTHIWALLHEESPRNVPFMPHNAVLQHFNYTSTFSRYSDFPLTTQYLPNPSELTGSTYMMSVNAKNDFDYLSSIMFIQTDCDTMSGREAYVRELMHYISIDSYGNCLRNRDLPENLVKDYLNNLYSPDLYRLMGKYKFILAYENGICADYITEKFWRPLIVGSIPIYFGAPTIKDWAPNAKSVIYINDFDSPKALAEFIKKIDLNDTEYMSYLEHKYNHAEPIKNKRLEHELLSRGFSMENKNLFGAFECAVCKRLHEGFRNATKIANSTHYNCTLPLLYPRMQSKVTNDWGSIMAVGKCQAAILDKLLQRNINYTNKEYMDILNQQVNLNLCN